MKKFKLTLISILLIFACSIIACKKDPVVEPNQLLIDQMKSVTDSIIKHTKVPGIVALVVDYTRGINWIYCAGVSDIPNAKPMNANHTFRIGSNTKTMTGTVLLQLVDEEQIELTDKLSKYYPEYPNADSITIAMLCNMTSGIFNYSDDETWGHEFENNPTRKWSPQEIVDVGFSRDFYFSPGTGWKYSNTNTILIGMIIEKITGNSLEDEIKNRIIIPLQLNNTGLITDGTELPGVHGRGYYSGEYIENDDVTELYDVSWGWAAGSAYSTPRELQKYVENLVKGTLLSSKLQQQRLNDLVVLNDKMGYGLCIAKRGSFYGHNGALPGYTTSMYHSLDKNCTAIIYFNCSLELQPDFLFFRFMDILYGKSY